MSVLIHEGVIMSLSGVASSPVNPMQSSNEIAHRTSYSMEKIVNLINRVSNIALPGAVIFSAGQQVFFYNKQMSKYVVDHQISQATGWGAAQERSFIFNVATTRFAIDLVHAGGVYLGVRAINYLVIKLNDYLNPPMKSV
jgi:hypothetical protein